MKRGTHTDDMTAWDSQVVCGIGTQSGGVASWQQRRLAVHGVALLPSVDLNATQKPIDGFSAAWCVYYFAEVEHHCRWCL